MSYYAEGNGSVVLKTGVSQLPDDVYQKLTENFEDIVTDKNTVLLYFNGKYRGVVADNSFVSVLDSMNPFIAEGYMELEGEDGDKWKYEFSPSDEDWIEYTARTVWDTETGLTDAENKVVKEALERLGTVEAKEILNKYTDSFKDVDTDSHITVGEFLRLIHSDSLSDNNGVFWVTIDRGPERIFAGFSNGVPKDMQNYCIVKNTTIGWNKHLISIQIEEEDLAE